MSLAEVEELLWLLPSTTSTKGEGRQDRGEIISTNLIDLCRWMCFLKKLWFYFLFASTGTYFSASSVSNKRPTFQWSAGFATASDAFRSSDTKKDESVSSYHGNTALELFFSLVTICGANHCGVSALLLAVRDHLSITVCVLLFS